MFWFYSSAVAAFTAARSQRVRGASIPAAVLGRRHEAPSAPAAGSSLSTHTRELEPRSLPFGVIATHDAMEATFCAVAGPESPQRACIVVTTRMQLHERGIHTT